MSKSKGLGSTSFSSPLPCIVSLMPSNHIRNLVRKCLQTFAVSNDGAVRNRVLLHEQVLILLVPDLLSHSLFSDPLLRGGGIRVRCGLDCCSRGAVRLPFFALSYISYCAMGRQLPFLLLVTLPVDLAVSCRCVGLAG